MLLTRQNENVTSIIQKNINDWGMRTLFIHLGCPLPYTTQVVPFLTFFRSRGASFSSRMINIAADGTTSIRAMRFWMVSLHVTFKPLYSAVARAMSSPIFFGD
jgi:hypothetical protein